MAPVSDVCGDTPTFERGLSAHGKYVDDVARQRSESAMYWVYYLHIMEMETCHITTLRDWMTRQRATR